MPKQSPLHFLWDLFSQWQPWKRGSARMVFTWKCFGICHFISENLKNSRPEFVSNKIPCCWRISTPHTKNTIPTHPFYFVTLYKYVVINYFLIISMHSVMKNAKINVCPCSVHTRRQLYTTVCSCWLSPVRGPSWQAHNKPIRYVTLRPQSDRRQTENTSWHIPRGSWQRTELMGWHKLKRDWLWH